jgi:hypothetical protein
LVSFTLYDDVFIPSDDPCGRNGPNLDQLVNKPVSKGVSNGKNQIPIITNSTPSKNTNALLSKNTIKLNNNNNDEDSDDSNDDVENLKLKQTGDEFVYTQEIQNGKDFKEFFEAKCRDLTDKFTAITVDDADKNTSKYHLYSIVVRIKSKDEVKFTKVVRIVKTEWRVITKQVPLVDKNEFDQLLSIKNEIIKKSRSLLDKRPNEGKHVKCLL